MASAVKPLGRLPIRSLICAVPQTTNELWSDRWSSERSISPCGAQGANKSRQATSMPEVIEKVAIKLNGQRQAALVER